VSIRTERTRHCGRCFHPVAPHPWVSWTGHIGDGPCQTNPIDNTGKHVPCACPAPVANRFEELSDDEQAAEVQAKAQRRA
jgi:hypothetical protein